MNLSELLDIVREELPQCELTSVVDLKTGLSLATSGVRDPVSAAMVDAFGGEAYRLVALLLPGRATDNIVMRGPTHVFVSTLLDDTGYYWHLSTRAEITLGFSQAVIRKYHARVTEVVRALVT